MKNVHLVICDLLLPKNVATEVCAGLALPSLELMLARGRWENRAAAPLEMLLCEMFGMPRAATVPVAPVSARFDGLESGCWMRADPVHLQLQQRQMVMLPEVTLRADEAGPLCSSLNEHFAAQGLEFFAPHPQRWYLRLEQLPELDMVPVTQAVGRDVHELLPTGKDARRWHQLLNEIQMLLFTHPVNAAREARGGLPINSIWLWGGGCAAEAVPCKRHDSASADEILAQMLASAAGVSFSAWAEHWQPDTSAGSQLLVWTGLRQALQHGDLAAWRTAVQQFEAGYAAPLWRALHAGEIERLDVEIVAGENSMAISLTRADAWKFWRQAKPLASYSIG